MSVKAWDVVHEEPSVVGDVEQVVPIMVEEHGQEEHVEKQQHEVVDSEVVAVEWWRVEVLVQSEEHHEVVVSILSGLPCQNLRSMGSRSSMSSEAKSSEKVAWRAGETKV